MHTRAEGAKQRRPFEPIQLGATPREQRELLVRRHPLTHPSTGRNTCNLKIPHRARSVHPEFSSSYSARERASAISFTSRAVANAKRAHSAEDGP
jgi:hypothetical protein